MVLRTDVQGRKRGIGSIPMEDAPNATSRYGVYDAVSGIVPLVFGASVGENFSC